MTDTEQQRPTHRFGIFELDLQGGELRKRGVKLKLQQQPFQILGILLERPGEVVTREEIQKRLWPQDTYVDFDNAINSSIRKLREALGDNAESPRFIETLPRRGYRFIAPVSHPPRVFISASPPVNGLNPSPPQAQMLASPAEVHRTRPWLIASAVASLLAFSAGLGFWLSRSHTDRNAGNTLLKAVPFTSYPGYEILPSFSPDGTRVAFSWQQPGDRHTDVYIKLVGPGEPVRLSRAGGFGAVWSPDGRFIAFLRPIDRSHTAVIVEASVGGQERELTRTVFAAGKITARYGWNIPAPFLAWSPDGKWLLTLDQDAPGLSQPHKIVRVSVESGEKHVLTSPAPDTLGDGGLALAPDGKTLAFTQDSGFWTRDIYVVPLTTEFLLAAKPKRVTFDNKAIVSVAWSGDGKHLVFSSPRNGKPELWVLAMDRRSDPLRLALTDNEVADLAVSRDGKHAVYSHPVDDQNIWSVSLHGQRLSEPHPLVASTRRDTQPGYSPDGKRIAFESDRSGSEEVWLCNADGSDPVQLTYFGNAWAGAPRWSPDGEKIAFAANAAGNWDIYVINSGGGKPMRLTHDSTDESWPTWSRDGKWIYYFSNRGRQAHIWKMRSTGGPEIQVTKNAGYWSDESVDGKVLYYMSENGLWKIPTVGGDARWIGPYFYFAAVKNGIYCAYVAGSLSLDPSFELRFVDSKTHQAKTIGTLPGPLGWNINISPDERQILYAKMDREGSELILIENFQ